MFVEEDDRIINPFGVKGMGELGMDGIPAAIANAVFHATGKRIRTLPITPNKRASSVSSTMSPEKLSRHRILAALAGGP